MSTFQSILFSIKSVPVCDSHKDQKCVPRRTKSLNKQQWQSRHFRPIETLNE